MPDFFNSAWVGVIVMVTVGSSWCLSEYFIQIVNIDMEGYGCHMLDEYASNSRHEDHAGMRINFITTKDKK